MTKNKTGAGQGIHLRGRQVRPSHAITAIGSLLTCGYRADGLRAWKQGSTGGKTYFLYDGGVPIIEMDSSGNVANINVFAPDGLVGRKEGSTWTYYTFDQQGNVAQRLDASQAVQTSRVFDAWGEGAETTLPRSVDCWNYNAQWGYYNDRETGLYYCQNRMYDASTGRWINRDPIGYAGGINLYGYCGSGPVGANDPTGTFSVPPNHVLYKLVDKITGVLQKWGITKNPGTRYSQKELTRRNAEMKIVSEYGTNRRGALDDERVLVEEMPGPDNHERWAGTKRDCAIGAGGIGAVGGANDEGPLASLMRSVVETLDPTGLSFAKSLGKDIIPSIVGPYVEESKRKRQRAFEWWTESEGEW